YYAPSSAAAHNTLGTLLLALGRSAEARQAFTRAIELGADRGNALNNLCYVSFLEGELSQAMNECRAALVASPGLVAARNNLALIYAASQREDLALDALRSAGDGAAASYNLGMILFAQGQYTAASKAFDAASRQRPSWSTARARARRSRVLAAEAD